jgi:hypothetical protein
MEELRAPVRCPRCNAQPSWQEVRAPEVGAQDSPEDPPGRLGRHGFVGWRCNNCGYFLAVSQWES